MVSNSQVHKRFVEKSKKIIAYFFSSLILLQSCSTLYLPTTFQDSVDNGPVKITYQGGQKINYEKVAFNNGNYYGERRTDTNDKKYFFTLLDTMNIKTIEYESKVYIVWLKTKNANVYVKGVLYDVNDSLIIVGSSIEKSDYLSGHFTITEYPISKVEKIMIRPYGKVGAGAGIGFITGALLGGIMYGESGGDPFFLILIYSPLTALTTLIGTIVGSSKKSYKIDNYTSVVINEQLRKYCFKR